MAPYGSDIRGNHLGYVLPRAILVLLWLLVLLGMCRWPLSGLWLSQLSHFLFMNIPYQSFKRVIVLKCTDPFFKLKEHLTFHPEYKHSGTFANRKYEELSYPKNQKMCDPILVTLLKM